MADLRTSYLGVSLSSPVVVGACSLSKKIDGIKAAEDAGAGALVIKSLFEEQVQIEQGQFSNANTQYDDMFAEALSLFPKIEHGGPKEHLYWVEKTRKEVKMPLFASLNCTNNTTWVEYARLLENTGVNGLELNFYSSPLDSTLTGAELERRELETLAKVRAAVKVPIAVKLHPYYSSLLNHAPALEKAGANGLVLFNRLFQPDINVEREEKHAAIVLSEAHDLLLPLRWTALLHERVACDVIASGGITTGRDVVKMVLAGAAAVQTVSSLYRFGPRHVEQMNREISEWMKSHHYKGLSDFRGKLGKRRMSDVWSFERGQYIRAILGFD